MSLFTCFSPFSQRRRRDAATPHERRRLRRSLRSKGSSRATHSLPFSDGPFSSAASSTSWVQSAAAATTDTGGESGRSSQPAHQPPLPQPSATAEPSLPSHLTDSPATTSTSSSSPPDSPASPASSCGGSATFRAQLHSPAPTTLASFPPPSHPPQRVDRGNPRLPRLPLRGRGDSAGSTATSMGRTAQASLSMHSITDDSSKTAAANQPFTSADPGPLTTALRPHPAAAGSSFTHPAALFSPASSLCESPTHHASFQSWLQTGSARSTSSPPASARIRALSLAAETNLSSDFSVHLYVDPPRSARSAAILAACSNAAAGKAPHLPRSRSAQGVDYCGVLPTTVEEEIEDTASIPLDATADAALRISHDASSIALDTADGHKIISLTGMSSHSPSMTQHSSSLADVSADVLVDMCGPDAGTEMNRDFANAALAGEDVMSTVGTSCDAAAVDRSRLGVCSFPGTIMSSLHSTASGSLLGLIAARMPQPPARMPAAVAELPDANESAPLWEDPAAEDEGAAVSSGEVREDRCGGAIADSAGIPIPSASIAAYSSMDFTPKMNSRKARSTHSARPERRHDAAELRDDPASELVERPAAGGAADTAAAAADLVARLSATLPHARGDQRGSEATSAAAEAHRPPCRLTASAVPEAPSRDLASPPSSVPRAAHAAERAFDRLSGPPTSAANAYTKSEIFLPAGLKPYRVYARKPSRAAPLLRPTYSISSIPTTPPVASLGSDDFSGSISCPASRVPSRVPSAAASVEASASLSQASAAPESTDSIASLPQPYSIVSSIVPISSDASTILPASTMCPTSLGSTLHPTSVESSAAHTSIAPASTVGPTSTMAPTSAASTNTRTSCDIPGAGNGALLPASSGSGSSPPQPWNPAAIASLQQRYAGFAAGTKSPRLRHYPSRRPARLRPSPRNLKSRTPNATLTLFPSSGSGPLPRPLTPNFSPRNFTPDLTLRPHNVQPSTRSTQHSSNPPSLETIADAAAQACVPDDPSAELSTAGELSTVDEISTVPEAPEEDEQAVTSGDIETTGEFDAGHAEEAIVALVPYASAGSAELNTTGGLEASAEIAACAVREWAGDDDTEGSDEILALPGLPSSMSSVHSGCLSASLQRQKQVVDQLVSTGTASSYMTVDSCVWGTPRSRRSRRAEPLSSSGHSSGESIARVPRPLAGPQLRHVYRASRIDVAALLAQNQCAAAAAAAAAAKPGTLGSPETAVQAAHERVLSHVPLAHEAQPRGAHFGVLPARRAPPDSVGSTLSTASVMLPASRGHDGRASIDAPGPPNVGTETAARSAWR
eukprot:jgi/Ulvmu1/8536/UM044_0070.1